MASSQFASKSGLSLEAYLQLHKALTKHSSTVQSQSVIEECYYKVQDLKQLLALHGMSSSKFNRSEVLQALKGKYIVNPTSIILPHSTQEAAQPPAAAAPAAEAGSAGSSILLPFSQADLGSLGWAVDPGCALEQLHLGMPAGFQATAASVSQPATGQAAAAAMATAVADNVPSSAPMHVAAAASMLLPEQAHPELAAAAGVQQQQQQQQLMLSSHAPQHAAPQLASSAAVPAAAAGVQHQTEAQTQQAAAILTSAAPVCSQPQVAAQAKHESDSSERQAAAAAATEAPDPMQLLLQSAGLQDGCRLPKHMHTPWMLQQLRLFVAGGPVASREKLPPPPAAGAAAAAAAGSLSVVPGAAGGPLLGRGIGFVLLEDMQVAGAKGATLTLPAGVYEGRAIKYLGSSCHPDVCDDGCSANHQFYRARVMPPQLPQQGQPSLPGQAEAISQAHAAASGRPVLLILDLHARLRCSSFAQMLQLAAEQLQDAWVLLAGSGQEQQQQQHGCSSAAAAHQPNTAAAAAAAGGRRKKGRPAASGQPGACKRPKA